jgi:PAS domain S-box-containing protein
MDPDYQKLFEATPHAYMVLRPEPSFPIAFVNDRYLAVTRTERAAIVGRGLFEVFPENPDDPMACGPSDLRASLERVIRERAPDVMGVQKYDIPDGRGGFEARYWTPVNSPMFGDDGEIVLIIHHAEDVTEFVRSRERAAAESVRRIEVVAARADRMEAEVLQRADEVKQANRELKAANEELERKEAELSALNERLRELDKAKSEFFANASHELRTPLTLILAPIEDLLDEEPADSPRAERLRTALRNALRLQRQVDAVLEFSRVEAGAKRVDLRPIDLAVLTRDIASAYEAVCDSAGLSFEVECPPLPGLVRIDPDIWEKIVLNLLSNAFKFTLRGHIRLSLSATPDGAELTVRDSGAGIPADQLPHIFERFRRVAGVAGRSIEGSGIGLALVRELVRTLGGSAHVDSVVGEGSAFAIRIPIDRYETTDAAQGWMTSDLRRALIAEGERWVRGAAPAEAPPATDSDGPLVVIADDNADMRDFLTDRLRRAGYRIHAANDGLAALGACRALKPALLLSDVMMPELDGLALTRALRADEATAALPIVLLSARAGETARIEGFEAGADEYLEKPFGSKELVARVDSALRLARARTALVDKERRIAVLARQASVVETAMDAIVSIDETQHIVQFNAAAEAMFGCSRTAALGQPIGNFIPPRDRARHVENVAAFARTGMSRRLTRHVGGEVAALRANGAEFPAQASISRAMVEGETLLSVILRDITAQRQAERELRDSEQKLRTILDGVGACVYLKDREGRYLFANEAVRRLWNVTLDDIVGFGDEAFFDPATAAKVRDVDRRVLDDGETLNIEETVTTEQTGETVTYLSVKLPLRNSDGEIYALCGISTDITESARAAARVIESERQYRSLFENMNSGFVLFDVVTDDRGAPVDLVIRAVNQGFLAATGLTGAQLIGRRMTQALPGIETDAADWIGRYGRVALTGEACQFEQQSETLGRHFSVAAYRAAPDQCAVSFQDITERVRAEEKIRLLNADLERRVAERTQELDEARRVAERDNERLQLALAAGAIGAWDLDLVNRNAFVDRNWRAIYGLGSSETVAIEMVDELIHPDDVAEVRQARSRAWDPSGDGQYFAKYRIRRRSDGAVRWISSRATFYFEDGVAARAVGVGLDVTDERQLELSLREQTRLAERVAKSEERLRAVFDGVGDAIITMDESGRVQSINRSGVRIFGYDQEEIVGRSFRTLVNEPYRGADDDYVPRHAGAARSAGSTFAHETEGRRKDGSVFPVALAISEVKYDNARLFVGFARDLSAQRKAEAEAEILRTERVAAIGGMAAALAHEINQPFLAAAMHLHTARDQLRSGAVQATSNVERTLALAESQILRAGEIIKHLREFSSSGEPNKTFQSLHGLIEQAIASVYENLEQAGIEVVTTLDAGNERVLVDKVQIRQVLVNLIRNAKQAMSASDARRLAISTRSIDAETVCVDIADTGVGLTAEARAKLFELFASTKDYGMGIGLCISRSIIQAHYGELWAGDNPEGGAIFSFTLPAEQSAPTRGDQ